MSNDPTSQANFLQVPSDHIDFSWYLDFEAKVVAGSVTHHLHVAHDSVKEIV